MPNKNAQLKHFLTKGMGQYHEPHRVGTLYQAAAAISYYVAREKNLSADEFVVNDSRMLYCAELKYKQNDCGMVFVRDNTDTSDFEVGQTPYSLEVTYIPEQQKDVLALMQDGTRDQNTFGYVDLRGLGCVSEYFELNQDIGHNKLPELKCFNEALTKKIGKLNPHFQVAALL